MSAETGALLAMWLAIALIVGAAVAAVFALNARALFAATLTLAAMAALAAAAVLVVAGGDGALALAAFGVGLAPVLMLGAVLLTARAAKPSSRGGVLLSALAIVGAITLMVFIGPEFAHRPAPLLSGNASPALWLAALVFVAVIGCAGLLGYGQRGVLQRPPDLEP